MMKQADPIFEAAGDVAIGRAMQRARGAGRLVTKLGDGATRLAELYQDGCAKIRLPKTHGPSLQAVLINTAGGLTGGDQMAWEVDAAADCNVVVTTQAAERVYKSTGANATVRTHLTVGSGAHLDWLPQETILFGQSRLRRSLEVDLAAGASFTGIECVLLGRQAMGEAARDAVLRDDWRVRVDGHLVHAEATWLDGSALARDSLSLLNGAVAFATLIYVGADIARRLLAVRALLPSDARIGCSASNGRLVVRALANSGMGLRKLMTPLIAELSGAGSLPRLWTI